MGSWKLHLELADCGRMTGNSDRTAATSPDH
jgi:hypothetical protein